MVYCNDIIFLKHDFLNDFAKSELLRLCNLDLYDFVVINFDCEQSSSPLIMSDVYSIFGS